ncbi:MAG: HlyD family secretion protein [Candidatus Eremiobacteraeota bacterium]|nr:HlyD family secretion protein [Candidatus Eremiobacteraeota bacterium]
MEGTRPGTPPAATGSRGETHDAVQGGRSPALRLILIALGIVVVLVIVWAAVPYLAYSSTHETTDDATVDSSQVQVTSQISERVQKILVGTNQYVHRGQLLIVLDSASERDRYAQALAAVQAGNAQTRAAQENVALTRDTQSAQNLQNTGAIAQAQAAITSADKNASSAQQQIAVAQAGVAAADAQVRAAQDALPGALQNLRRADADLKRTASLVSTGDIAASQLDAARATEAAARSSYAQTQANVAAAQAALGEAQQRLDAQRYAASSQLAQVGVQRAQLTTAQGHYQESSAPSRVPAEQAQADAQKAQISSLQAALKTVTDNLSYTEIRAPIDAFVGEKDVEVGQTVGVGVPLLTLIPSTDVYITANYKETQIGRMHVGDEVDISVDAYRGVKFVGHVSSLSPASQNSFSLVPSQNATGNFVKVTQRLPVRIVFDRVRNGNLADYPLRPGLSVETSVKVK